MTILLDPIGNTVADMVFLNSTPHPHGYLLTDAVRVRRALWGYQWAMENKANWCVDEHHFDYFKIPSLDDVLDALREWEKSQALS